MMHYLGNARLTTNGNGGGVYHQIRYHPYGSQDWSSGLNASDYTFTARRLDGFGLLDYHARYYDSTLGRFISPDSVVPDYANPQALNRYAYALNNPVKYNDPSGHCIWDACIVEAAIIGAGVALSIDFAVQVKQNMDAGMSFWDAGYHENINEKSLATSTLSGVMGGALGAGAIPVVAAITGAVGTSAMTAIGVTDSVAGTIGTTTSFVTDMGLAGTTNAVLASTKRTFDVDDKVTWESFSKDLRENYSSDFKYGAASSAIGQILNAGINANFPETTYRTQPHPVVMENIRWNTVKLHSLVYPFDYNPHTPAIRSGLQTGALILSDTNVLQHLIK